LASSNTVSRYRDQFALAVCGFAFTLVKKCSLSPFSLSSAATAAGGTYTGVPVFCV